MAMIIIFSRMELDVEAAYQFQAMTMNLSNPVNSKLSEI